MSDRNTIIPIPEPTSEPRSLLDAVKALKEAVETMTGQRGDPLDQTVTYRDLVRLKLLDPRMVPQRPSRT